MGDSGRRGRARFATAREFLRIEAASSVLLLLAAIAALIWANLAHASYADFWHITLSVDAGSFEIRESLQHWVNDALMAIFFFVVGLEIKHELVNGDLRDRRTATLPVVAALGGMVVPAGLYLALNAGGEGGPGWGIPMATDIAFAVGVIGLLGRRIPTPARLFLLTLAIVDDIGAILVIAVFYSDGVSAAWIAAAVAALIAMVALRKAHVWWTPVYVALGVACWVATYESGVHATLAGVAIGLITAADSAQKMQHQLHPLSSFVVLPIFALANAGVDLGGGVIGEALRSPIALGVVLGLVLGKPLGIVVASWCAVRLGIARLPAGTTWLMVTGLGLVAGVGFTVSLFIAQLSFPDSPLATDEARVGILAASLLAAVLGTVVLRLPGRLAPEVSSN